MRGHGGVPAGFGGVFDDVVEEVGDGGEALTVKEADAGTAIGGGNVNAEVEVGGGIVDADGEIPDHAGDLVKSAAGVGGCAVPADSKDVGWIRIVLVIRGVNGCLELAVEGGHGLGGDDVDEDGAGAFGAGAADGVDVVGAAVAGFVVYELTRCGAAV